MSSIIKNTAVGAPITSITDLPEVFSADVTDKNVLVANGVNFVSRALTEADISDLGTYMPLATVNDIYISQTSVTQHQASLSITESQISDLQSYIVTNDANSISSVMLQDDIVEFAHLGAEYTELNAALGTAIDWSLYTVFTKTISGSTTFTDSNLRIGTKYLLINGDHPVFWPSYWQIVSTATYDGSGGQYNLITVTCFDATPASEVVVASIVPYTP